MTFRSVGYKYGVAAKLYTIGMAEFHERNFEVAREILLQALEVSLNIGDSQTIHAAYDVFAGLYVEAGDTWNAALLAGFSKQLSTSIDYQLEPVEARFRERYLIRLRELMDPEAFEAATSAGQQLTWTEAAQLATSLVSPRKTSRGGLRLVAK